MANKKVQKQNKANMRQCPPFCVSKAIKHCHVNNNRRDEKSHISYLCRILHLLFLSTAPWLMTGVYFTSSSHICDKKLLKIPAVAKTFGKIPPVKLKIATLSPFKNTYIDRCYVSCTRRNTIILESK